MGLLDKIGDVAHWVVRQKHHKELAVLERAIPQLRIIEDIAREVDDLGLSGHRAKMVDGLRLLEKRLGRRVTAAETVKLREHLR